MKILFFPELYVCFHDIDNISLLQAQMVEVLGEDAGRPDHVRPEELHRPRPDHPSRVRKLHVQKTIDICNK